MDMKVCGQCNLNKPVSEFHKDKTMKFGLKSKCKECSCLYGRHYYSRDNDSRFKSICARAKQREKDFSISPKDIYDLWEKQKGQCAYTKLPLLITANQPNTVSLDRVDSSKGYCVGNIQLVCAVINRMKRDYTEDQFIRLCHLVAQNNKQSDTLSS